MQKIHDRCYIEIANEYGIQYYISQPFLIQPAAYSLVIIFLLLH